MFLPAVQSIVLQDTGFQHILRVLNTNVDGRQKIMYALTAIKGCGRRFANLVCKKADIDMRKRYVLQRDVCVCVSVCVWCVAPSRTRWSVHRPMDSSPLVLTLAFVLSASGWWRANDTLHSAGELKADEVDRIVAVIQNPRQFKIPVWGQGENAGPQQGFWMRGSSSCPWLCRFRFCVPA